MADDLDPFREELLRAFVPEFVPLLTALSALGVPVASQATLVRWLGDVRAGSIRSPYMLSRAMGMTPAEAQAHPATGPYLALVEYAGPERFKL